jgi:phosphoenolpyruvate phosphomutase
LSARLAEEAGFDGIWASGFELSAAYGVPDASLLSLTQHLDMTRAIIEQVAVPVVADIDTGYGNAINVLHVVAAYAAAGAAAVVMEDKLFPKDTSLLAGGRQELVRIEEFQGKIAAAREAGKARDLIVIARTEALIADLGLDEALEARHGLCRGRRRPAAGAFEAQDAGRDRRLHRALAGENPARHRADRLSRFDRGQGARAGQNQIVIYANHAIRAAVSAMREVFAQIRRDGGIHQVDKQIASVEDIFELQRVPAMKAAEKKYLR